MISGLFLYTSIDPSTRQRQSLTRRGNQSVPPVVDAARLEGVSRSDESRHHFVVQCVGRAAAPLLRRSGIIETRHGGDTVLAEFLGLNPHAIARSRRQLLEQDVEVGRIRQPGAGRKPVEKNA